MLNELWRREGENYCAIKNLEFIRNQEEYY